MTSDHPYFMCQLVHQWLDFRVAELEAAAHAAGVRLSISPEDVAALRGGSEGVLLRIGVDDEASVVRLASRAVLCKTFFEVWASGDTWEELEESIKQVPSAQSDRYLAAGTTFRVRVVRFGLKCSPAEQKDIINKLAPLLPWRGKVQLSHPDHTFCVVMDVPQEQVSRKADGQADGMRTQPLPLTGHAAGPPGRYYFGRLVAEGQRGLVGTLDLKKRNYIGTTSLDAELSLVMANLARVGRTDLVYDPYCGTGSCLVAAAAFGARVQGADLFLPVLQGKLRTRCGPSALQQASDQGIAQTFSQYGFPCPVGTAHADSGRHLHFFRTAAHGLFDAIITDPPYGIREKPAAMDDEPLIARLLPEDQARLPSRRLSLHSHPILHNP